MRVSQSSSNKSGNPGARRTGLPKSRRRRTAGIVLAASSAALGSHAVMGSVTATWTGNGNNVSWTVDSNWSGTTWPGNDGGGTLTVGDTDVAVFNSAISGSIGTAASPISITTSPNPLGIGVINFTGNADSYNFASGNLYVNRGINLSAGLLTASTETFNSNVVVQTGAGSTSQEQYFLNNSTSGTLVFAGGFTDLENSGAWGITFGGSNTNLNTVSGVIQTTGTSGTLTVTKQDAGVWQFTDANTYRGSTAINGGLLLANNVATGSATSTGAITVAGGSSSYGGAELGGNGVASGTVTLSSSGTLKEGGMITAGNGTLTSAGSLVMGTLKTGAETWKAGSVYQWGINSAGTLGATISGINGTPGSNYDDLAMGGSGLTVTYTGGLVPTIEAVGALTGVTLGAGGTTYHWVIAQSVGTLTVNGATVTPGSSPLPSSDFALDTSTAFTVDGSAPTAGAFSLEFETLSGANDLVLTYDSTPEPTTGLLVLSGLVPLLIRRRRNELQPPPTKIS